MLERIFSSLASLIFSPIYSVSSFSMLSSRSDNVFPIKIKVTPKNIINLQEKLKAVRTLENKAIEKVEQNREAEIEVVENEQITTNIQ